MVRRKKHFRVDWERASDIKKRVNHLVSSLKLDYLNPSRIYCYRSFHSSSRAYARIWGFSKIWQLALSEKPAYVIEVLAEKFDRLSEKEKDKVLLHELTHIPKNFSGSLVPHIRKRGKRNFHDKVEDLIRRYLNQ